MIGIIKKVDLNFMNTCCKEKENIRKGVMHILKFQLLIYDAWV